MYFFSNLGVDVLQYDGRPVSSLLLAGLISTTDSTLPHIYVGPDDIDHNGTPISSLIFFGDIREITDLQYYNLTLLGDGLSFKVDSANYTGPMSLIEGSRHSIRAILPEGYHFQGWSDGGVDNPHLISMPSYDYTLTAYAYVTVTLTLSPVDHMSYKVDGVPYTSPLTLVKGTSHSITVVPDLGYKFVKWSDLDITNPRSITLTSDTTLSAEVVQFFGITCLGDNCTFTVDGVPYTEPVEVVEGSTHTIVCIPQYDDDGHYRFVDWEDLSTESTRVVTVTESIIAQARTIQLFTLTLSDMVDSDSHITYTYTNTTPLPGAPTTPQTYDTPVEIDKSLYNISFTTEEHFRFVEWDDHSHASYKVISLDEDTTLSTFTVQQFLLTINSDPLSDNRNYVKYINLTPLYGAPDTEVAYAAPIWVDKSDYKFTSVQESHVRFVEWDDDSQDPIRLLTISADTTLTTWVVNQYLLTINPVPQSDGHVTVTYVASSPLPGAPTTPQTYDTSVWVDKGVYNLESTLDVITDKQFRFVEWDDHTSLLTRSYDIQSDTILTTWVVEQFILTINPASTPHVSDENFYKYYLAASPLPGAPTTKQLYETPVWVDKGTYSLSVEGLIDDTLPTRFVEWDDASTSPNRVVLVLEPSTFTTYALFQYVLTLNDIDYASYAVDDTPYIVPITFDHYDDIKVEVILDDDYAFQKWTDEDTTNPRNINAIDQDTTLEAVVIYVSDVLSFTGSGTLGLAKNKGYVQYSNDKIEWFDMDTSSSLIISSTPTFVRQYADVHPSADEYVQFSMTGSVTVSGSITSMGAMRAYAYHRMFEGCSALVDASGVILPSGTNDLNEWCYAYMFKNCTSLVTAPSIPNLLEYSSTDSIVFAYYCMFDGCTSLLHAPSMSLYHVYATGIYEGMFRNCTALETASCFYEPHQSCCSHMYYGANPSCVFTYTEGTRDAWLECHTPREWFDYTLTLTPADHCTYTVGGAPYMDPITAPYGTELVVEAIPESGYSFTKWSDDSTDNPYTITLAEDVTLSAVVESEYATITLSGDNVTFTVDSVAYTAPVSVELGTDHVIQAVPATGYAFTKWSDDVTTNPRTINVASDITLSAVVEEDFIEEFYVVPASSGTLNFTYITESTPARGGSVTWSNTYYRTSPTGSWISATSFSATAGTKYYLKGHAAVTDPDSGYDGPHPVITIKNGTTNGTFKEIGGDLSSAIVFTGGNKIYAGMFRALIGGTYKSNLSSNVNVSNLYLNGTASCSMLFRGCSGLVTVPKFGDHVSTRCYVSMFQGCTSLTEAPALPATTLATSCYASMFQGCTSLTEAYIKAPYNATNCQSMFSGITTYGTLHVPSSIASWGGKPTNWNLAYDYN